MVMLCMMNDSDHIDHEDDHKKEGHMPPDYRTDEGPEHFSTLCQTSLHSKGLQTRTCHSTDWTSNHQ